MIITSYKCQVLGVAGGAMDITSSLEDTRSSRAEERMADDLDREMRPRFGVFWGKVRMDDWVIGGGLYYCHIQAWGSLNESASQLLQSGGQGPAN